MTSLVPRIFGAAIVLQLGCSSAPPSDVATNTAPHGDHGSPMGTLQAPEPGAAQLTGTVAERLAAGRYSYLRIQDAHEPGREHWVATMGAGAEVGAHVVVRSFGTRRDFESPRLGRRFDALTFGSVRLAASA